MAAKIGMKGTHSSNIPTVEDPRPNNAIKIGMMTTLLLPLNIFIRKTTSPSKAPLRIINDTDAKAINTKKTISPALTIPLKNDWKNSNGPTGDASTSCHVPGTTTIRPDSFSIRSNSPAGIIHVKIAHTSTIKNRIIKICGRLNFFFSPSLGPLLINNLLSDLSAILFTYHNLCSSLSLFTVFCIIFSTDSDISDRGELKLLTVMPGVKLFYIFIYVTTAKKIFGYILTLISCMTKSPENPDSVKNHKHSSSVFPHHCRMVLEYLM